MTAADFNPLAAILFCDLRNAFGSIHRGFLRAVLVAMDISNSLLNFFDTILTPSTCHVLWRGDHFTSWTMSAGVPQGSCLSAWLFVVCMNVHLLMVQPKLKVRELQLSFADDLAYLLVMVESLLRPCWSATLRWNYYVLLPDSL
eukprot:3811041-Amphidinium_carterae.5